MRLRRKHRKAKKIAPAITRLVIPTADGFAGQLAIEQCADGSMGNDSNGARRLVGGNYLLYRMG